MTSTTETTPRRSKLRHTVKLLRISNWVKNGLLFVPLIFSFSLTNTELLEKTIIGFFAFSFIASGIYILNDLFDRTSDAQHPTKKDRPLASGVLTPHQAVVLFIVCEVSGFLIAASLNIWLLGLCVIYVLLNIIYNLFTKHVFLADLATIIMFYILRIFMGGVIIHKYISVWLILMTFLVALMAILAKRKVELDEQGHEHRPVLAKYNSGWLGKALIINAGVTTVVYFIYSFTRFNGVFALSGIFVAGFLWRYLYLVLYKKFGERPEQFIKDIPSLSLFIGYALFVILYLYAHTHF